MFNKYLNLAFKRTILILIIFMAGLIGAELVIQIGGIL